ncbi:MAG: cation:proton antiporter [Trueperaceae bacterium]|nr:cation:proton antiporter [Trueperaceae bacterium]
MQIFGAAPHDDILMLLIRMAVLLVAARLGGWLAQRLDQPAVMGEILAGVVLGPSLLSGVIPWVGGVMLPQNPVQGYLLEFVGFLGATFLLIITGLEIDLPLIRRHARTAVGIAAGGMVTSFTAGAVLGSLLPDSLLADPTQRTVFVLFIATAMAVTAIPVLAKVLIDLKLMRRDIGQTIMAVGMIEDTFAWILLSVILGLAGGVALTVLGVLGAVGKIVLFMGLSFTAGRWLLSKALDFVQDRMSGPDRLLSLVVAAALVWGAVAQAIGIEAVLGAFVVGVLFGTMRRLPAAVIAKLHSVTMAVFAPIFFALAGLKVDLPALLNPQLLPAALAVIVVANVAKIGGAYLGARLRGQGHWRALAFGSALNARGAVEIIIATIGLFAGILSREMYSIIVLVAVTTSVLAPLMLRALMPKLTPDADEQARLELEELSAESPMARLQRVLLPLRLRPGVDASRHRVEAFLLDRIGADLAVTLMTVAAPGDKASGVAFLNAIAEDFSELELTRRVVESTTPIEEILEEAGKDYDLIVLGATEGNGRDVLFSPLVDYVVRMGGVPSVIVKGRERAERWPPRKVLVPSNGSFSSRQAAELAFGLVRGGESVVLVHVLERLADSHRLEAGEMYERQVENARTSLADLQEVGRTLGVEAETRIDEGGSVVEAILRAAQDEVADLIVLGTEVRSGSDRLFLGPRVERILSEASCPVLVVNVG